MNAYHVLVRGKVQGVWYRQSTKQKAEAIGLSGWVRNLKDGRVEALLQGSQPGLDTMLAWMKRGPENAVVEELQAQACECDAHYQTDFVVLSDGIGGV